MAAPVFYCIKKTVPRMSPRIRTVIFQAGLLTCASSPFPPSQIPVYVLSDIINSNPLPDLMACWIGLLAYSGGTVQDSHLLPS